MNTHTHKQRQYVACGGSILFPCQAHPLLGTRLDSDTDSNKCQKQQQEAATFSNYKRKGIWRDKEKVQPPPYATALLPSPSLDKAAGGAAAATDCSWRAELLQVLLIELSQHHVAAVQRGKQRGEGKRGSCTCRKDLCLPAAS